MFSFFPLAVVGIQRFYGLELSSHFFCWQLLVYKVFMGKSYVLIFSVHSCWYTKFLWARVTFSFFSVHSCWYTKFLWPRVTFSFFPLAVVGIQSFYGQELRSNFFKSQLLVYKVLMGKSYVLIFPVGSCWYTNFSWPRVIFAFFLLAVVGIQSFYGQELCSHFSCWQLLVYKVFINKSYVLIFSFGNVYKFL